MQAVVIKQTNVAGGEELAGQSECVSADEFMSAARQLRCEAVANGTFGMSMEEINDVIAECRQEWREKECT